MWLAGVVVAAVAALLAITTLTTSHGKTVLVIFGILALVCVLIKELTGAFVRDSGVDEDRKGTLEKAHLVASVYAAVFGVPAVVTGILGVVL